MEYCVLRLWLLKEPLPADKNIFSSHLLFVCRVRQAVLTRLMLNIPRLWAQFKDDRNSYIRWFHTGDMIGWEAFHWVTKPHDNGTCNLATPHCKSALCVMSEVSDTCYLATCQNHSRNGGIRKHNFSFFFLRKVSVKIRCLILISLWWKEEMNQSFYPSIMSVNKQRTISMIIKVSFMAKTGLYRKSSFLQ